MQKIRELPRGRIYLTLGTVEQLKTLWPECGFCYEPTTHEMRRLFEQYSPYDPPGWILWPRQLRASGLIKKTGSVASNDPYSIPTDQLLKIHPQQLIFIPFCSLGGQALKDEAKKLQGGPFEILDLRAQFKDPFPLAQRNRVESGLSQEAEETRWAQGMIEVLQTPRGPLVWGKIKSQDIYRWFRQPNNPNYIPLLSAARAWGLEPYLKPFLDLSESQEHREPGRYLNLFALWVYLTTQSWGEPRREGLRPYTTKVKGIPTVSFNFTPSGTARSVWLQWTCNGVGLANALPILGPNKV
jgi:hypothetical protein